MGITAILSMIVIVIVSINENKNKDDSKGINLDNNIFKTSSLYNVDPLFNDNFLFTHFSGKFSSLKNQFFNLNT